MKKKKKKLVTYLHDYTCSANRTFCSKHPYWPISHTVCHPTPHSITFERAESIPRLILCANYIIQRNSPTVFTRLSKVRFVFVWTTERKSIRSLTRWKDVKKESSIAERVKKGRPNLCPIALRHSHTYVPAFGVVVSASAADFSEHGYGVAAQRKLPNPRNLKLFHTLGKGKSN